MLSAEGFHATTVLYSAQRALCYAIGRQYSNDDGLSHTQRHPRRLCRAVFNHSNSTKKSSSPGSGAWPSAHGMEGRAGRTRQNPAAALHRRTAKLLVRERADASPRSLGTGLLLLRPAKRMRHMRPILSARNNKYTQLPSVTRAYSAERACSACEQAACLTSRCYR